MKSILLFVFRYLAAWVGFLYVATFGLLKRYHRDTLHEILFRLGWRTRPAVEPALPPLRIPTISAAEAIGASPAVRILEPDSADGNVSGYELAVINALVATRSVKNALEIGTFDGRTTLNLAAHQPADGHVFTLDLPPEQVNQTNLGIARGDEKFIVKKESGARYKGRPEAARITQLYGDSASFDFTPYAGQMDLVFIDGAHSYDYVFSDTRQALALLRSGRGLLLWHDYGSPHWKDLTRALNELYAKEPALRTMRHIAGTTLVMWERS